MTATVHLDQLWLNSLADPTDVMSFRLASLTRSPAIEVSTRKYATGFRAVTTPGKQRIAKVTLAIITAAQVQWLEGHMGVTVCAREGKGTKFWGVYTDSEFTPYWGFDGWVGPSFTIQQVTVSDLA